MDWVTISSEQILGIIFTTSLIYVLLMIFIKMNGLRSFAKMSSHDFAVTIAVGSILGAVVIQKEPSVLQAAVAIASFFALQSIYSLWRIKRRNPLIENEPLLLMDGPEILDKNLETAKITKTDLMAKLREANILDLNDVKAAILESTGDVSVLHGDKVPDEILLKDVKKS